MDNELRNAEQLVQLYEITNEDLECIKKLKKESDDIVTKEYIYFLFLRYCLYMLTKSLM